MNLDNGDVEDDAKDDGDEGNKEYVVGDEVGDNGGGGDDEVSDSGGGGGDGWVNDNDDKDEFCKADDIDEGGDGDD